MRLPAIISSFTILILSGWVWWQGTDGFRAFTSETARRTKVLEHPFQVPNIEFKDQNNAVVNFKDYEGKLILADFIYTRCPDICHNLGYAFKILQKQLEQKNYLDQVMIISISFDVEYDEPAQLNAYLQRYTEDTNSWHALSIVDPTQLENLLHNFGVVVIENEFGGYDHNAAIHVINKEGKLSAIYDYQSINSILSYIDKAISENTN